MAIPISSRGDSSVQPYQLEENKLIVIGVSPDNPDVLSRISRVFSMLATDNPLVLLMQGIPSMGSFHDECKNLILRSFEINPDHFSNIEVRGWDIASRDFLEIEPRLLRNREESKQTMDCISSELSGVIPSIAESLQSKKSDIEDEFSSLMSQLMQHSFAQRTFSYPELLARRLCMVYTLQKMKDSNYHQIILLVGQVLLEMLFNTERFLSHPHKELIGLFESLNSIVLYSPNANRE